MNNIPLNLLPRALKKKVDLPNLYKIEILHKKQSSMMINTLVFMKKFAPNIKFHNQHLEFKRTLTDRTVPLISVYGPDNKKIQDFEPGIMTPEEILRKIRVLNGDDESTIELDE